MVSAEAADPDRSALYMKLLHEDGKVFDQWAEMTHSDGDELVVDVLKVIQKKMVTDAVRQMENADG